METVFDILYYLNKLDFTEKVNDDDFENLRCVKKYSLQNLKLTIYLN